MDETTREHLGRLLEDVKGDPKTSAALVAMLEAICGAVRSLEGRVGRCEDCGSTQGAALAGEDLKPGLTGEPEVMTAQESNAIGAAVAALTRQDPSPSFAEAARMTSAILGGAQ